MALTKAETIAVRGSEVMKLLGIGIDTWRGWNDEQREHARKEARKRIAAQIERDNVSIHEQLNSLQKRVTALESGRTLSQQPPYTPPAPPAPPAPPYTPPDSGGEGSH